VPGPGPGPRPRRPPRCCGWELVWDRLMTIARIMNLQSKRAREGHGQWRREQLGWLCGLSAPMSSTGSDQADAESSASILLGRGRRSRDSPGRIHSASVNQPPGSRGEPCSLPRRGGRRTTVRGPLRPPLAVGPSRIGVWGRLVGPALFQACEEVRVAPNWSRSTIERVVVARAHSSRTQEQPPVLAAMFSSSLPGHV